MMSATSGRLSRPGAYGYLSNNNALCRVSQTVAGSAAILAYDGSDKPSIRDFDFTENITPDGTYAFKVVAINAVGEGISSLPSATVVAREGASPSHTTASGTALQLGTTGFVHEVQHVSFKLGGPTIGGSFRLRVGAGGAWTSDITATASAAEMTERLKNLKILPGPSTWRLGSANEDLTMGGKLGDVFVTRSDPAEASAGGAGAGSNYTWSITFIGNRGNIDMLELDTANINDGGNPGSFSGSVGRVCPRRRQRIYNRAQKSDGAGRQGYFSQPMASRAKTSSLPSCGRPTTRRPRRTMEHISGLTTRAWRRTTLCGMKSNAWPRLWARAKPSPEIRRSDCFWTCERTVAPCVLR